MKRISAILLALMLAAGMSACASKDESTQSSSAPASSASSEASAPEAPSSSSEQAPDPEMQIPSGAEYTEKMIAMYEGTGEYADNPVVTLETSEGVIKIRLFPEESPKAAENFMTHVKNGYYDGISFHRVINDFMIQGGDPDGNGTGGESIWNQDFEIEYSPNLWHLRGCLSMANTGQPNSNGSQFFIVQGDTHEEMFAQFGEDLTKVFPQEVVDMYKTYQGYPALDLLNPEQGRLGYTKFGYVFEGMDVVDKIAAVKVDGGDKPVTPVTIVKATVQE